MITVTPESVWRWDTWRVVHEAEDAAHAYMNRGGRRHARAHATPEVSVVAAQRLQAAAVAFTEAVRDALREAHQTTGVDLDNFRVRRIVM